MPLNWHSCADGGCWAFSSLRMSTGYILFLLYHLRQSYLAEIWASDLLPPPHSVPCWCGAEGGIQALCCWASALLSCIPTPTISNKWINCKYPLCLPRSEFYKHIVLSGGSTMYPGLPSRLERELKQLYLERVLKGDVEKLSVSISSNYCHCLIVCKVTYGSWQPLDGARSLVNGFLYSQPLQDLKSLKRNCPFVVCLVSPVILCSQNYHSFWNGRYW